MSPPTSGAGWRCARFSASASVRSIRSETFEERRREIALGKGRDDGDDHLSNHLRARAYLERGSDGRAGRDTYGNAFKPRCLTRGLECGLVRDGDDLVDDLPIENGRNEARADSLNFVRSRLSSKQN